MPGPFDDSIDPITGQRRSRAQMGFFPAPFDASLSGMPLPGSSSLARLQPQPQPQSPMSGNNSSVRPPRGGGQRPAPNPTAPAVARVDPWTAPVVPEDTRDPSISVYDRPVGDWYQRGGDPSELRMEAGTDLGLGTPGPQDPSYYAERGKKAPRPDRGFLQSLSDGFGDAMTGIDQYVRDTPNLLTLGINMMAAANAPSKSEQWQQFAGSFDKFGQANRVDEDRKLAKEDREREIKRQAKQDARADVVAGQQDTEFGWSEEQRTLAREGRKAGIAEAQRILDTGVIKDPTTLASFQLAARGIIPVQDAIARLAGVDDKTRQFEHEKELARLQAIRDDARMRNQVDIAHQKQLEMDALVRNRNNLNETHVRQGSLNNLYEARDIITKLAGVGKDGRLAIDTNATLSALFDPPEVASYNQQLKSLAVDRGIGLLKAFGGNDTDKEFNLALDTIGNPANSLQSQFDTINRQIAVNEEAITRFGAERVWAEENENIYARNKAGQSFTEWYYGKDGPGSKARSSATSTPITQTTGAERVTPTALSLTDLGATPSQRITEALKGLQGAKTPEAYQRTVAALSNMPKDELAKAMAQAPISRFYNTPISAFNLAN